MYNLLYRRRLKLSLFQKKYRTFDLESKLHKDKQKRIEFDRLPRKKVKPFWWSLTIFIIVVALFYYLQRF